MFPFAPMPLLGDFLLNYNAGQVVLLLFILSIPAAVAKSSMKILALNAILFGGLFVVIPSIGAGSVEYAYLGVGLLVIGPMLFVTGSR
ncbi:MAG: hypothetical protein R3324_07015 [Halobacteriales archaeon]|nr:hypothetical protein [Halobacteriales archaeon]